MCYICNECFEEFEEPETEISGKTTLIEHEICPSCGSNDIEWKYEEVEEDEEETEEEEF
jgi:rRNA maturation endonuclease Nob1